jgi:muramoyltetrapeptide carboxypeptidase LdcA involved in peptidoglycan recycling
MIDHERLLRPRALAPGDRLAAISLSWGGPGAVPHRYDAGVRQLSEGFGVEVVPTTHALRDPAWLEANPRARADDLMSAFADDRIAGIVSTIGGDDSIRILPFLDLDTMRENPKVFLGFSDATITHMACLRAGLVSFYGPAIMAGFAENTGMPAYMVDGVRAMLFEPEEPRLWPEHGGGWTVEHLDWFDPSNQSRARALRDTTGWRWHGDERAEGPLVAGCVEVLDWLRGTPWWPDLEGAVLAIETSEEAPPPEMVARFLRSLAASGELEPLGAILLGRPGGADLDPEHHLRYDEAVLGVVRREHGLPSMPVVTGMDFGHTDPMWTLPIGVPVRVDPGARQVSFLRSGTVR